MPKDLNKLQEILKETHRRACHRGNTSTIVFKAAYESNGGDLVKSIIAGLSTLGGKHAPIKQTFKMLSDYIEGITPRGPIYFGFGSSFAKGEPDEMLEEIHFALYEYNTLWDKRIKNLRKIIFHDTEKDLYGNLAYYSAAVAIESGCTIENCEELMIEARISEWCKMISDHDRG